MLNVECLGVVRRWTLGGDFGVLESNWLTHMKNPWLGTYFIVKFSVFVQLIIISVSYAVLPFVETNLP